MGVFDTIFHTTVDVVGGPYALAGNEAINLAKGGKHTDALGIVSDVGDELARQKTTDIVMKDTAALNSKEGDAAAVGASSGIQADKRVQTAVNTGYDIAQAGAGVGAAAGLIGGASSAGAAAAETVPEEAGGMAETGLASVPSAATPAATPAATSAAPDVISGAGPAGPDFTGAKNILPNSNAPQQFGNAASNAGAEVAKSKTASVVGHGIQAAGKGANAAIQAEQQIAPPELPTAAKVPGVSSKIKQMATPEEESLLPHHGSYFDSVFGSTMGVKGTPDLLGSDAGLNPLSGGYSFSQATPSAVQAPSMNYMQPMAPAGSTQSDINQGKYLAMSDQTKKQDVKPAERSIQDFLSQIYGKI